jgi:hypothetical protein
MPLINAFSENAVSKGLGTAGGSAQFAFAVIGAAGLDRAPGPPATSSAGTRSPAGPRERTPSISDNVKDSIRSAPAVNSRTEATKLRAGALWIECVELSRTVIYGC